MSGCECKTGFFALRACEQPVAARCPTCRRAMCRKHAADPQLSICLDCAAGQRQATRTSTGRAGRRDHERHDRDWLYERRHDVHGDSLYRGSVPATAATATAVAGAHATPFDQQDARAFDQHAVERDDDGPEAGGFGDS